MMTTTQCQMQNTDTMHEGKPQLVSMPLRRRLLFTLAQRLDPRIKRFIKHNLKRFTRRQASRNLSVGSLPEAVEESAVPLQIGDVVRIRSLDEIRLTLNADNRLKGCKFMPEMELYCGTIQRVFKPVERYLNECDYTVRKAKGLVILENLFCQGVAEAGRCDRSCFYFWRVEWLEKLEKDQEISSNQPSSRMNY
jgi:hypothetical protein